MRKARQSDKGFARVGSRAPGEKIVRVLEIVNQRGLHARASAKFVQTVERFDADIRVTRCGETVGGDSIMGLMMLAAASGTSIEVEATGPDAEAAMRAIEALVAQRFGEDD
jgi:phosphocarrier protein HPr